jgi:hypothetical protein
MASAVYMAAGALFLSAEIGMAKVRITGWGTFENAADRIEEIDARLLSQSLNRAGDKGKTQVSRATARVTGLPYYRVLRVEKVAKATPGKFDYRIEATDGFTSLADFKPRETRAGVSAAPWGERRTFGGSFAQGGQFPHRVPAAGLHDQIFKRVGDERLPIERLYGPSIPVEIVKGEPKSTWQRVTYDLKPAVLAEVRRRISLKGK